MHNFFVEDENFSGNSVLIKGDDYKHIVSVLRMNENEKIQVCNKKTKHSFTANIEKIEKEKIVCRIIDEMQSTEPKKKIVLFQGIPKSDKMEYIIQKCTELGVNKIVPVEMKYCIAKINNYEKKLIRWNRIAESAAKQSKRNIIPEIDKSIGFKDLIKKIKQFDLAIVAYEKEKNKSIKSILQNNSEANSIAIIIGPEGGIDEEEVDELALQGANCVSLGKRVLRTETAPISILSMIMYEYEL